MNDRTAQDEALQNQIEEAKSALLKLIVELAAQTHELNQVETPKLPEMPEHVRERLHKKVQEVFGKPTIEQQLIWATTRCAELQAKVHRMQSNASVALMWLQAGDKARVQQAINQVILDL